MISGLKCPGCGSQRAVHSLLNFDFLQAFRYNALLVVSVPLVLVLTCAELMRGKKPVFYSKVNSPVVIWGIFGIVVLWWILRNVFDI